MLKYIKRIFSPIRLGITLAVGVFLWLLIFGDQGIYQLNRLHLMKKRLSYQSNALRGDIENLIKEKEFLKDEKKLEPIIRKELGFIRPGEVVYQEKTSDLRP